MLVRATMRFRDLVETEARGEDFYREEGEAWEVSPERAESLAESKWGPLALPAEPRPEEPKPKRKGRPTKSELLAEAEMLGVDVPRGATNPQIAKLIEEAR